MEKKEFQDYLTEVVNAALNDNVSVFHQRLNSALSKTSTDGEVYATIFATSIALSAELSVQIVFDILEQVGLLQVEDLQLHYEKPKLTVLRPPEE